MVKPWNVRLRELRKSRDNMTQQELAAAIKRSQGLISGLENAKKKFTQGVLDEILGVLKYSYRDVFCEKTKEELEIELEIMKIKLKMAGPRDVEDPDKKNEDLIEE